MSAGGGAVEESDARDQGSRRRGKRKSRGKEQESDGKEKKRKHKKGHKSHKHRHSRGPDDAGGRSASPAAAELPSAAAEPAASAAASPSRSSTPPSPPPRPQVDPEPLQQRLGQDLQDPALKRRMAEEEQEQREAGRSEAERGGSGAEKEAPAPLAPPLAVAVDCEGGKVLTVCGLPGHLSADDTRELFAAFGPVVACGPARNGGVFCQFMASDGAKRAMEGLRWIRFKEQQSRR